MNSEGINQMGINRDITLLILEGIRMKQLLTLILILFIMISFSGCCIPDLPGPIGIPGL